MKAVILAGGLGLRLRPLTEDRPKAMVPVNGTPIAEIQLRWLAASLSPELVVFACGYRWERIREYFGESYHGTPIEYVVEDEPMGTAGALRNVIKTIGISDENIVVMNGDVVTDLPIKHMLEWHVKAGVGASPTIVTMLLIPYRSQYGVVRINKLGIVRKFEEKPEFPDVWINGGVYIVQPRRITRFLPEKGDLERETFPKLVEHGEIAAYPYYGFWRSIDTVKALMEAEEELRNKATTYQGQLLDDYNNHNRA
ncbi:MAG: nucleotidyltransferase family protein [Candidatus Caldarchaeum sp.]